jgi:hypothetical protein
MTWLWPTLRRGGYLFRQSHPAQQIPHLFAPDAAPDLARLMEIECEQTPQIHNASHLDSAFDIGADPREIS